MSNELHLNAMKRRLLYAGLVLVNLMPFIYGLAEGYSIQAPFVNLIALAAGEEYDAGLFLLVLVALLLTVAFITALVSFAASGNAIKPEILHPSDGRLIAEKNQQKVLQLQQLLQEEDREQSSKAKRPPGDTGLDMNIP